MIETNETTLKSFLQAKKTSGDLGTINEGLIPKPSITKSLSTGKNILSEFTELIKAGSELANTDLGKTLINKLLPPKPAPEETAISSLVNAPRQQPPTPPIKQPTPPTPPIKQPTPPTPPEEKKDIPKETEGYKKKMEKTNDLKDLDELSTNIYGFTHNLIKTLVEQKPEVTGEEIKLLLEQNEADIIKTLSDTIKKNHEIEKND